MVQEQKIKVLVVDDHEVTRQLLKEVLERQGYAVSMAESGEAAVEALRKASYPVVISDIRMLELDGMAVLREAKKASPDSVVILMTGFGSMEGAIEAIQEGAFDYVSKPFKMDDLKAVVARAIKHWESIHEAKGAPASGKLDVSGKGLIGKSPKIVEVYKTLARAAMSNSTVLVSGENGTGKQIVARAIHDNGPRRAQKFTVVDCGALDEALLEAELFGGNGTLFLDDVVALSQAMQVKLLRFLEAQKTDVRVIAATHDDLEALVKAGKFREDLHYRLKVISIHLPPLRERIEDLPELVNFFVAKYAEKNHKPVSHVSEGAMALLRTYGWPGNIRELEHAIERAVALTNASVLFEEDFPAEIRREKQTAAATSSASAITSLEEMEKAHILKVLQEVSFNKSKASEMLGIDRATLYRKAQRYGIDLRGK